MAGTVALIIAVTTVAFTAVMLWLDVLDLFSLVIIVALFNIAQWLIAPYLVNLMYRVKKAESSDRPELHQILQSVSQRSGVSTPKLMLSKLTIPNAFAYGSPLTGNMVAVTDGLLSTLNSDEVEAVIGHEVGHLKHRDMQAMMMVSFLPSLFYMVGSSMLLSGMLGGGGGSAGPRSRRSSGSGLAIIGGVSLAVYFILTLLNLGLSRQREYYADRHSVSVVDDGARKLSTALAKISSGTWRQQSRRQKVNASGFKSLFISDPDRAGSDVAAIQGMSADEKVREILNRRVSGWDRFMELFSTHPNIVKRLRAIQSV